VGKSSALTRSCQRWASLPDHFAGKRCFPVIYFISDIFFVPPSETSLEAGIETNR
jgi:hypothetical protein